MKFGKMSEISTSPIIELHELSLHFQVNYLRSWTMRQLFVEWAQLPRGRSRSRRETLVVADKLNFKACRGERIGILGLNGAGKSSLCRCIAGIYRPTSGEVKVQGEVRAVFNTSIGIQPELTGRENIRLLAELLFPLEPNKERLVSEVVEFTDLGHFIDAPFRLYSNGMQTRIYLSLVSSRPSDVFILDEVFEGADHIFSGKVADRMLKALRESGVVLFVSHSPSQVKRVCSRVIVLERGRIVFDGPVLEGLKIYSRAE